MEEHGEGGRLARLRSQLAQALFRDPAVVLLDRAADEPLVEIAGDADEAQRVQEPN